MTDIGFQYAPIGLAELEDRVIRRCNALFAKMFSAPDSEITNLPIARLYPSIEEFERVGVLLSRTAERTGLYGDERIMRRLDGTLFWCRVRGQSLTPQTPFRHGIWSFADLSDDRPLIELTARERDVAILTARGLSAKEIGAQLGLSHRTVESHRARLLEKFNARKLPELVAKLSGMPL